MSRFRAFAALGLLALSLMAHAAETPTAESLMAAARKRAKAEDKNVLVLFGASWCGWCKKLDALIAKPEFKPLFDENFVIVHLTVFERADKLKDENPGALDILTWMGGNDAGLPFFGILDAEGRLVVTSNRSIEGKEKGPNVGFPVAEEEVAHFIAMLKKSAKRMTPEQLTAIEAELTKKS